MLYSDIRFPDTADYNSIIVSLHLSKDGVEFNNKALETIVTYLEEEYCKGLTIEGDSLSIENRRDVHDLVQTLRAVFGSSKEIRLHTDFSISEVVAMKDLIVDEILRYVDSI